MKKSRQAPANRRLTAWRPSAAVLGAFLVGTHPAVHAETPLADTNADALAESATAEDIALLVGRSQHISIPWPVAGASLTEPNIADVQVLTPNDLLISGKNGGATDLFVWGNDGESQMFPIAVTVDLDPLTGELTQMFPDADLDVALSQGILIISGKLRRAEESVQLKAYLDALETPYVDMTVLPGIQQVQVQVRIAEVSRTAIRAMGVNGFVAGSDFFGGSVIGPSGGGPINPISIGPPEGGSGAGNTPFVFNQSVNVSPAVTLFGGVPSADLEFFIQALAEDQILRLLAEPNLTALSGEEASFLAGGEFPIPVVQGGSGTTGTSITIEYREFGVGLKFRPQVLGDGAIRLNIASEVSDLTDIGSVEIQGFQIPAVVTRRADTTLEVKSGQTFAIAGLMNESTNAQVSKVPGLGSLPILGQLFRSIRYRKGETELLVLVTASLVEPTSELVNAPLPGSGHIAPNDWELFTKGRIEGEQPGRLSPEDAQWLRSKGFERLRGPGPWSTHETPAPQSSAPILGVADEPGEPTEVAAARKN